MAAIAPLDILRAEITVCSERTLHPEHFHFYAELVGLSEVRLFEEKPRREAVALHTPEVKMLYALAR